MPVFGLEGNWQDEDDDEECDDGVKDLALWDQSEDEEKLH